MIHHNANEPEGANPFGLAAINSLTLLADFAAQVITSLCRHGYKTVALAGSVTFAGVLCSFAVIMTLALIDTIAVHLCVRSRFIASGKNRCRGAEHTGSGNRQGNTRGFL
jgi:hypothetical protein